MSELLEKLKAGAALTHEVWVSDCRFVVRLLSDLDRQRCQGEAAAYLRTQGVALAAETVNVFDAEVATRMLARAVLDPETNAPVFASADAARSILTAPVKDALLAAYVELESDVNPRPGLMPEADYAALVEAVKKTPQTTRLSNLSGDTLRRLIITLASPPST